IVNISNGIKPEAAPGETISLYASCLSYKYVNCIGAYPTKIKMIMIVPPNKYITNFLFKPRNKNGIIIKADEYWIEIAITVKHRILKYLLSLIASSVRQPNEKASPYLTPFIVISTKYKGNTIQQNKITWFFDFEKEAQRSMTIIALMMARFVLALNLKIFNVSLINLNPGSYTEFSDVPFLRSSKYPK